MLKNIASITFAAVLLSASSAFAISSYTPLCNFFPMETTDCNLAKGKTFDDYREIQKKFGEHLHNLGAAPSEAI